MDNVLGWEEDCAIWALPSTFQSNLFCSTSLGQGQAPGLSALGASCRLHLPDVVPMQAAGHTPRVHTQHGPRAPGSHSPGHTASQMTHHTDPSLASVSPPVGWAHRRHIHWGVVGEARLSEGLRGRLIH